MKFRSRKLVKPEDLNAANTLFGGRCCAWIDEEAAIFAICQLDTTSIVTKTASFDFLAPARQGDIIEIGVEAVHFGRTSLRLHVVARNKNSKEVICELKDMTFVTVDPDTGRPIPHGKTEEKPSDD
jgi:acyl-CoA hydrolase